MKKIIYTRPDGGISIVHPIRNTFPVPEILTDDEIVARAWAKLPAGAINPQIVEMVVVPSDRTFRNAWKQSGGTIVCDMAKAREIHRDRLRAIRAPKFAPLDAAWFKAAEVGDETVKAAVAAKKQALRDVTIDPAIDAAKTPEELKVAIPSALL